MDAPAWLDALRLPAAYPDPPTQVEALETHISWLFFAGTRVYKIKKPVDFGFLDYSSLCRRQYFCSEELRLNRRLAPRTYLRVVSIRRGPDARIRIGGGGEILDFAVEMRRLPATRMLAAQLAGTGISAARIRNLARILADFHRQAARSPKIARHGRPEAIAQLALANFATLRQLSCDWLSGPALDFVESTTRKTLGALHEPLIQRMQRGHICEGHGDLHAGNICLAEQGVVIYDCVEFSAALRCGDVSNDLAFLLMDLEASGHWALAADLCQNYIDQGGDPGPPVLLTFYKAYRSMVRVKVGALQATQTSAPAPRLAAVRYLQLATSYMLGPALILVSGLPGSGKSWLATRLSELLGAVHLSSDLLRQAAPTPGQRRYELRAREQIYQALRLQAGRELAAGRKVIVDASFARRDWRLLFRSLADDLQLPLMLLELEAEEQTIAQRLDLRSQQPDPFASEADFAVFREARAAWQASTEWPENRSLKIRSPCAAEPLCGRLLERLLCQVSP